MDVKMGTYFTLEKLSEKDEGRTGWGKKERKESRLC